MVTLHDDWTGINDLAERRRIQNRLAQRKYREQLKKRKQSEETSKGRTDQSQREVTGGRQGFFDAREHPEFNMPLFHQAPSFSPRPAERSASQTEPFGRTYPLLPPLNLPGTSGRPYPQHNSFPSLTATPAPSPELEHMVPWHLLQHAGSQPTQCCCCSS